LLCPTILATLAFTACTSAKSDRASSEENEGTIFTETTSVGMPTPACGTGDEQGCYTNYGVVADLDGDGNLDLVMANGGDHFVASNPEPQVVLFGDGTGKFTDGAAAFPGAQASIVRQIAIADFDGDGRLDVFAPAGYGTTDDQLWLQTAPRVFENQPQHVGGGKSHAGAVHAGDIDGDGDIDLVIADWGDHPNPDDEKVPATPVTIRILENDGHGNFKPGAVLEAPNGSSATDIDLHDVNGDFALDIVLTNRNGQSRLYLNDGKGVFTDVTETLAFPKKRGPFTFNAELCDVDGDGDLDLLFDGGSADVDGHDTQLLINDGTGRFTDESERIVGDVPSDDNQVKCVDFDNDGHFDLIVASLSNPTEKLFKNDGTGHFEAVPNAFPALTDPTLAIDVGDFDGDGRIDLFTGQGEVHGASWIDRIFKNTSPVVDRNAPVFRKVERPKPVASAPTIVRFAVSDAHTSETGQHLKAATLDVTINGSPMTVPAKFIGGDIFRAVVPAQPAGTRLELRPHAIDRAGNSASAETFPVVVE
jgi:hypothetical protein